jgi:hypothetical protein
MAPKITAKVRRTIVVPGVGNVVIELSSAGIKFRAPGTKLGVSAQWADLVNSCKAPPGLPKKFENNPLAFLQHQASTQNKKRALRLTQRIIDEIAGIPQINSSSGNSQRAELVH